MNWMTAFKGDRSKISNLWNIFRGRLSHLSSDLGQAVKVLESEFKSALPKVSQDFPQCFCSEAGVLLTLTAALFVRSATSRDLCRHTHWAMVALRPSLVMKYISQSSWAPTLSCFAQPPWLGHGGGCPCGCWVFAAQDKCTQQRTHLYSRSL